MRACEGGPVMNNRNASNLLAALLAAGVLALAPDARAQVQTNVSGSVAGSQSETACSISVFPDRVVEVIVANDGVEGGGFLYDNFNRRAFLGASFMGWYFRERTTAD